MKKLLGVMFALLAILSPLTLWAADQNLFATEKTNTPIKVGDLLYVVSGSENGILSIIDPTSNEEIKTIPICAYPWQPVVRDRFLYITGNCFKSLIIDTANDHKIIQTIVDRMSWEPILHDKMLYFFTENRIYVMDTVDEHNIVMEKPVCKIGVQPILHNNLLFHATNWRDFKAFTLQMYDKNNFFKKVNTLVIKGHLVNKLYTDGPIIYADVEYKQLLTFDTLDNYAMQKIDRDSCEAK